MLRRIDLSDVKAARREFDTALDALAKAAPDEWLQYAVAQSLYENALEAEQLKEEIETAENALKAAAPEAWGGV